MNDLPSARTTEDIDLILRAEIVTDSGSMKAIRDVLDHLGFTVVETAMYTQFVRPMSPGRVKLTCWLPLSASSLPVCRRMPGE